MEIEKPRLVIFTDLDGTLLDRESYSHQKAQKALTNAQRRGIPVVFCSSKTRAEQVEHRRRLGVEDPFIVEDGGAIVFEDDYFADDISYDRKVDGFQVIELGVPYAVIRRVLQLVRSETGVGLKGYGDMTDAEVAEVTGLDREAAALAKNREYQETIVSSLNSEKLDAVTDLLSQHGLRLTRGGRFFAVSGPHDKGRAIDILTTFYRRKYGSVRTIGIGDSHNDRSMLNAVDVPVLVQKGPTVWEEIKTPNLIRVSGVGPEGWGRFVTDYLTRAN
jgi:mannosyl-3-phosphoglycerate phosphatase